MPKELLNGGSLHETHLEPRVAKLETGVEILTKDVTALAQIVRDQGNSIERQIKDLAVQVTQASAPRRTDWSLVVSIAMFVLAAGAAIFSPLNQSILNNKEEANRAIQGVQSELSSEVKTIQSSTETKEKAWAAQIDLITKQISARLNKLESAEEERNKADAKELREYRKAVLMDELHK